MRGMVWMDRVECVDGCMNWMDGMSSIYVMVWVDGRNQIGWMECDQWIGWGGWM
jgi:hypothetical protein